MNANNPGPGGYNHIEMIKSGPKAAIGRSSRNEMISKDVTPGPGSYKVPSKIADVPGYSLPGNEFKYV